MAARSALAGEHLYAVQGWAPADQADSIAAGLASHGVDAAVQAMDPGPEDAPPTQLRPAWWARPMLGLFNILGTVPGYGEFDVTAMFMIFLPIFSAILISDTGYGLLYTVLPLIYYRKLVKAGARDLAHLIITIGVCSIVWGLLTGAFFGMDITQWPGVRAVMPHPIISVSMEKESMAFLMWLSVTIGAIHLTLAHLWRAKAAFPNLTFLSEVGWSIWFWGIYGFVKTLLLKEPPTITEFLTKSPLAYCGYFGGALAILFAAPSRNPLKMIGLGLANFPLSAIGSLGDTFSYLRLMAIGLAGGVLATAFNDMSGKLPIFAMIPIVIAGHALNVSLSIISLFAHGVRLNMLEFSNNLGMQWSGYLYEPFSAKRGQEN